MRKEEPLVFEHFLDRELLQTMLASDELTLFLTKTSPGDSTRGWVPSYHFDILSPLGDQMGLIDLRVGHVENTYYGGNIGYEIFPKYRGRSYASKACKLLFRLAEQHYMGYLYITCNPSNHASRRTCEKAGLDLIGIVSVPEHNEMYHRGERKKCIYRIDLKSQTPSYLTNEKERNEKERYGT